MNNWLLFFYTYCFLGWCIESAYVSLLKKRWTNRGFMNGPFLPIYGCGAVLMLLITIPVRDNLLLTYLFGAVGATLLEYLTGVLMEALFKVRYWDYSNKPFNLNGHICLSSTIAWGFYTIALVYILHTPIESVLMLLSPSIRRTIVFCLTVYFTADFTLSVKAALDFRDLLTRFSSVREELDRFQNRLDAVIAFTSPKTGKSYQLFLDLRSRLDSLKQEEGFLSFKDELEQLKEKYSFLTNRLEFMRKDFWNIHPSITSKKFADALRELKEMADEKYHKK